MNSGLRWRAFTLGALLVSRIGSHIRLPGLDPRVSERSFYAGGAARGCWGTRFGLLIYFIAIAARKLGRNEAAEILNRAAIAGSQQ
jgi:preprotein translocase subunit SecY